ncbi:MAG: HU family DNA-binding protein [Gemmatimonadetes bacterium]|nr:HU family DNA-binding protein [Gemmatimonadota bacterium]MYC70526.1 HU family DNA-binding protein [Gemmatimonadota bacterium]MYI62316.1 HU family DNA-binding protein [Gemmatimonadota bacterium]
MTKADIVRLIAEGTGLTKTDTAAVVDGFIESVVKALEREDHIEIRGFGTFKVVERAPRIGRNPRTGAEVKIAGRKVPTFKPSKELRARVNGGNAEDKGPGDRKDALWQEEKAA